MTNLSASQVVLDAFSPMVRLTAKDIVKLGREIPIPSLKRETIHKTLDEAIEVLMAKKQPLIHYDYPVVVVGDIHGNLHDLIRIFVCNGFPPQTNYLFLGDYVDRGDYSIEVMTYLFALYRKYHENFILLRGNHEVREVNSHYGFRENIMEEYNDESMYDKFDKAFCYLPLAAILDQKYFCVHGGISPSLPKAQDVELIELPVTTITPLINDLLWSDPTESKCVFLDNTRGNGCIFGLPATNRFLKESKMKGIIRGHQCVQDGVETQHHGEVTTVFSSSFYELPGNFAGFLIVNEQKTESGRLGIMKHISRQNANFIEIDEIAKRERSLTIQTFSLKNSKQLAISGRKFRSINQGSLLQSSKPHHLITRPVLVHPRIGPSASSDVILLQTKTGSSSLPPVHRPYET